MLLWFQDIHPAYSRPIFVCLLACLFVFCSFSFAAIQRSHGGSRSSNGTAPCHREPQTPNSCQIRGAVKAGSKSSHWEENLANCPVQASSLSIQRCMGLCGSGGGGGDPEMGKSGMLQAVSEKILRSLRWLQTGPSY